MQAYEGDLMAQADVSYTWGREGIDQYDESLAGVRPKDPAHQFDFPVSAYDDELESSCRKSKRSRAVNWAREIEKFRRTTFG